MSETPVEQPTPAPVEGAGKSSEFEPITSQEALDRVLGQRLAREREKFADYGELQKKAAERDKAVADARQAAMTDQEKAVEAAKAEGRTEALTAANTRLVAAEARALAAEARFRNPVLAAKTIDLSAVTVGDDGSVDAAAIKAALAGLAESDPYLVDDGKPTPPKADPSQGGGAGRADSSSVTAGRDRYAARHTKTA